MSERLTPLLAQYRKIKGQHKDTLLLFRVGDFYEMFYEDAAIGAKALSLTLTSRPHGPDNVVPLAGVPAKALDTYIGRLVSQGFKVAVCDQLELPDGRKPVVKRDVVEVITPGTLTNPNLLEARRNNFLLAISPAGDRYGIAFADVSTGEFSVAEIPADALVEEVQKIDPSEILIPQTWSSDSATRPLESRSPGILSASSRLDDYYFTQDYAFDKLSTHFGVANLDGFGIGTMTEGICAAGAVLHYLEETQRAALNHIRRISPYESRDFLLIDRISRRNLELVERLGSEDQRPTTEGTLLSVLDRTHSPAGTRLLRRWVLAPLLDVEAIRSRQDAVEELSRAGSPLDEVESLLSKLGDLERISSRVALERANARDLVALRNWLLLAPEIKQILAGRSSLLSPHSSLLTRLHDGIEDFSQVTADITSTLVDDPPLAITDGGMIRAGANPELDELRSLASDTKGYIARLQETERERTGIPNLRVRFNSVFGYYIEVTKSYLNQVPKNYLRKQTVLNAERFITPELKEHEARVLHAEERIKQLELELLTALRKRVAAEVGRVLTLSGLLAQLDALASLARVARDPGYTRPAVDESTVLEIEAGRHPVVERLLAHQFIPNDARLCAGSDSEETPRRHEGHETESPPASADSSFGLRHSDSPQIVILTGPNMAGKSTYLRQVALIAIMAQIGSFVPATKARIGVVDKVFTRIGASDDLSRGVSTFLAEMTETANILNNATTKSLIILDEIGRGTATSDGIAIAWATVEYLHGGPQTMQKSETRNQKPESPDTLNSDICILHSELSAPRPKTLFATHYHELTDITQLLPRCANYSFTVREKGGQVLFMRKLKKGPADKSYGIAVAKLAGLPTAVIERAKQVLADFEQGERLSVNQLAPQSDLALAADKPSGKYEVQAPTAEVPSSVFGVRRSDLSEAVLAELRSTDIEVLSPLQAFDLLLRLKQRLAEEQKD
ncbi:DNA mismatch repair protein MutS [candidate division WOR-3 bacterium]|nr:DNA mismatch repair protein MutS [candidate division WOR-3 bacterium]